MWYVVQVRTGTEENILAQCRKTISTDVLEQSFIPYYEEQRHIRGEWTTARRVLFPGYIFMITADAEELISQLRHIQGLTKLLKTGEDIVPLTPSEVSFLQTFGGPDQIVEMSRGVIEGSAVRILSGPLGGLEGQIRKIDRHKRKAWLDIQMFGRAQQVQVGLEIVAKTE